MNVINSIASSERILHVANSKQLHGVFYLIQFFSLIVLWIHAEAVFFFFLVYYALNTCIKEETPSILFLIVEIYLTRYDILVSSIKIYKQYKHGCTWKSVWNFRESYTCCLLSHCPKLITWNSDIKPPCDFFYTYHNETLNRFRIVLLYAQVQLFSVKTYLSVL